MSRSRFLSLSAAAFLSWVAGSSGARAQGASGDDPPEGQMKKLMTAIKSNAYEDFTIECNETMRAALSKQQFEGLSSMMGPMLQPGHKTTYLGKLRRKGMMTYLWKLDPGGGKDEAVINMTIKDKKVAGFFVQ